MTTSRQIEANRANARLSTGPRTIRGKARASRSALRHGLGIPVLSDSVLSKEVEDLARKILGTTSSAILLEHARRIAEAQVDLDRIRSARHALLSESVGVSATPLTSLDGKGLAAFLSNRVRNVARLDRYERRALSRRKFAIRTFDAACFEPVGKHGSPTPRGQGNLFGAERQSGQGNLFGAESRPPTARG